MESLMSLVGNLPKSHIVLRKGRALAEPQDHILTVGPHYSELGVALISNLTTHRALLVITGYRAGTRASQVALKWKPILSAPGLPQIQGSRYLCFHVEWRPSN